MSETFRQILFIIGLVLIFSPIVVQILIARRAVKNNDKVIFAPVFWWGILSGVIAGGLTLLIVLNDCTYLGEDPSMGEAMGCALGAMYGPVVPSVIAGISSIIVWAVAKIIMRKNMRQVKSIKTAYLSAKFD